MKPIIIPQKDTNIVTTAEKNSNVMEILEKNLTDLEDNSKSLLASIQQLHLRSDNHLDELESEISKLQENVEEVLGPFWQQIKNEMFDAKCYIKEKEEEFRRIKIELENRENSVANMQNELKDAKTALFCQSSYTASLGATLCTLLWRACGDEFIAVDLLKQRKLVDFFEIVPDSLKSFLESFGEYLPSVQSKEYQFILSMIGIITNISAVSEGRKFLVNCQEGDHLIRELLEIVTKIPDSGVYIHRTILMVLYNVSLDKHGLALIRHNKHILPLLMRNISQPDGNVRYDSLKLLQSLAYDVKNGDFLATLLQAIRSLNLKEIQMFCTDEENGIIAQVIDSIESAGLNLHNEPGVDKILNGFQQ